MNADCYQPCAYLVEGVEPAALDTDGVAFQHSLALGLQRLTAASEVVHLDAWLSRCLALRLRPVLLFSSYESPLAVRYRSYCDRHDGQRVEWMVWPPFPEDILRVMRDPDDEVIDALSSSRLAVERRTGDAAATRSSAIWQASLAERLLEWIDDFGDLLPGAGLDGGPSRRDAVLAVEHRAQGAPRVVHEHRLKMGLAAGSTDSGDALKLDVGSWTIAREEIANDSVNQYLIFRCGSEVIADFAGRKVEIGIGPDCFDLGQIDERGTAEVLVPRGLDFSLAIDVRIIDGES